MIVGPLAVEESGIAPTHRPAFQGVADELDVWIMVRNVNKLCTSLIEHGYPTKGMSVHGKSADWGPQAGLICKNQELSKYQGKSRVPELNKEIEHSLGPHGKGDVAAAPLIVPKWRLNELERLKLIHVQQKFNQLGHGRFEKVAQIEITCRDRARPHTFFGLPTGTADQYAISVRLNNQGPGEPVLVICRTMSLTGRPMTDLEGRLPLTADYDLFNVCPSFRVLDLGGDDRFQNARADLPEIGRFAVNHGINGPYLAKKAPNAGAGVQRVTSAPTATGGFKSRVETDLKFGQAHAVQGHTTLRQNLVRQRLNARINSTYGGGDTVHHGAETMNPFPEADDFGITIFRPKKDPIGLQNLVDLNESYWLCRGEGYHFHINPLWGWKPLNNVHTGSVMQMQVNQNVRSV